MSSEDLNVKIGSKQQVLWEEVLKQSKALLEQAENNVIINNEMIVLAKRRIAEEKEKFK